MVKTRVNDNPATKMFTDVERKSLQGEGPIPVYHQLYLLIKRKITDGAIVYGIKLPTEQQVALAFGVSRITAKRVLDLLASDALIERKRGRGSHVVFQASEAEVDVPLVGMLERLADMSKTTKVRVLQIEKCVPPRRIADNLNLEADEKVHYVERVRWNNRIPFAYYESWTRGIIKGFTAREITRRQRFAIMEENGHHIVRIEQYLSAASVTANVAEHLELNPGDPVLTLIRRSFDESGDVVDLLHVQYHPGRFHYRMSLTREDYLGE